MTDLFGNLAASYPQLRTFMGEEAFRRAAYTHIDLDAPHVRSLDTYAAHFPETLRAEFPRSPHFAELAWIEYVLGATPVTGVVEEFAGAAAESTWGGLPLQFSSTLLSRELATNAVAIWQAMREGSPQPDVEVLAQPCQVLVWGHGEARTLRTICEMEHEAVRHVQASGSFSSLCDMLAERLGKQEAVEHASALLAAWSGNKMLAAPQRWAFQH
jgi:hypothetical protein